MRSRAEFAWKMTTVGFPTDMFFCNLLICKTKLPAKSAQVEPSPLNSGVIIESQETESSGCNVDGSDVGCDQVSIAIKGANQATKYIINVLRSALLTCIAEYLRLCAFRRRTIRRRRTPCPPQGQVKVDLFPITFHCSVAAAWQSHPWSHTV